MKISFSKGKIIIEPETGEELSVAQDSSGNLIICKKYASLQMQNHSPSLQK